jgi:site-specific recombinase XerD
MLGNGVPLNTIKEVLGHSSISVTADIYGQVQIDDVAKAVKELGSSLRKIN